MKKYLIILAVFLLPLAASAQRILKYTDHEPLGNMRTRFIKEVFFTAIEKESNGRLKIEDHWNSEISTGYDALRIVGKEDVADMGIVVPEYAANNLPLHQLFKSFPTGPTKDKQVEFFRQVYAEIPAFPAELEKENVVNLFFATGFPVAFFSSKPLNKLQDIKSEKWRSASFWHKDFLQNAGAIPVTMPWGEGIYTAMKDGTLDGLMVNVDGGYDLKVHEIAPNILFSEDLWMGHVYLLVMNKNTWESLTPQDKDAISRAAKIAYKTLGSAMESSFNTQIKQLKDAGASVRILEAKELEQWKADSKYQQIQDAWVKEQESKGVKDVGSVMEKVRAILNNITANNSTKMKIITIEEHFINATIAAATANEIEEMAPGHFKAFAADFGTRQVMQLGQLTDIGVGRIANMDANGIDMQILSYSGPATEPLNSPLSIELARQANDQMAAAVAAHPGRFLAFATLPINYPEDAAKELRRCVTELGFKGALINGTAHERFLDEPQFDIIFATAAELDIPLYFHPGVVNKQVRDAYYNNGDPAFAARFASAGIGWHYEVGIHVMRLIFAGVFDRHPNLQIIMGHWGEMFTPYIDRFNAFFPATASPMKHDFKYYMQHNIYVTPSGMFNLPQLQNTLEMMGTDRIMYSADYPYYPNEGVREFLENAPISQADKEKIAHGNAEKLFKLK